MKIEKKGLELCTKINKHKFIEMRTWITYMITCRTFANFDDRRVSVLKN